MDGNYPHQSIFWEGKTLRVKMMMGEDKKEEKLTTWSWLTCNTTASMYVLKFQPLNLHHFFAVNVSICLRTKSTFYYLKPFRSSCIIWKQAFEIKWALDFFNTFVTIQISIKMASFLKVLFWNTYIGHECWNMIRMIYKQLDMT